MIRDRGGVKWTSLMLPEHVQLLKDLWEEENRVKRPIIDEQMGKIIEKKILNSYQSKKTICVKYYCDGKINDIKGQITQIQQGEGKIQLKDGRILSIKDIISVS